MEPRGWLRVACCTVIDDNSNLLTFPSTSNPGQLTPLCPVPPASLPHACLCCVCDCSALAQNTLLSLPHLAGSHSPFKSQPRHLLPLQAGLSSPLGTCAPCLHTNSIHVASKLCLEAGSCTDHVRYTEYPAQSYDHGIQYILVVEDYIQLGTKRLEIKFSCLLSRQPEGYSTPALTARSLLHSFCHVFA